MLKNIFKKSKKKKKVIKPKIIVDIHEKNSLVPSFLKELKTDIEFKSLKIGDYIVGKTVIERKTFSDFISSMIKKRLMQQLKHLQQYKQTILIIEGNNLDDTNLSKSVRGQILAIILQYQIPIIFTNDSEDTALYLNLLAKQQLKKPIEMSLHSRIPKTIKEQKKYILESFPNIGPKTSEKLIKEFKTLENIFNSSEETLKEILKNKTQEFYKILHQK